MAISMYSASVPVFVRMFGNLCGWLDRAEAHAAAKAFDSSVLLAARLAPDMLPFSKQVQIASDTAKGAAARLAGIDVPSYDDNEATLADLRERARRTSVFVQSIPAERIDGSEARDIVLPLRSGSMQMKGEAYLLHFVLPNFYFHMTTAYALLRHNGVELGKMDYLGRQ